MALSWTGILFGIVLILIGWAVASAPSNPIWLYPAMGLTFVGGGIVTFIGTIKG